MKYISIRVYLQNISNYYADIHIQFSSSSTPWYQPGTSLSIAQSFSQTTDSSSCRRSLDNGSSPLVGSAEESKDDCSNEADEENPNKRSVCLDLLTSSRIGSLCLVLRPVCLLVWTDHNDFANRIQVVIGRAVARLDFRDKCLSEESSAQLTFNAFMKFEYPTAAPARRKKDAIPSTARIIIPCRGSKKMAARPATAKSNAPAPQNTP
jgi:hypothetical protein